MISIFRTFVRSPKTCPHILRTAKTEKKAWERAFSYFRSVTQPLTKSDNGHLLCRVLVWTIFSLLIMSLFPLQANGANLTGYTQEKPTPAQQYYLNPAREFELLKKILAFERNWKARAGRELVIGILYQKESSISSWIMEDWLNLPAHWNEADRQLEGVSVVFQKIELDSASSLEENLVENKIRILYITPLEVRNTARTLSEIARLCDRLRIGTFTGVLEYLDSGIAISFQLKEEKPQIFLNLEAARAQGLDFSSQLLRLARIRGKNG